MRLAVARSHRADIALVFLLALLPGLFFWRLITPNPADRLAITSGDFTDQYFPLRAFTAQEWVRGQVPLWNPYLHGGQPALADIQSGALYLPHVFEALLLGWGGPLLGRPVGFPLWALELQVLAHFSLAAVGTYLFARHVARQNGVGRRRASFGGVVAALVFTYGGYLTGFPVQQLTILEASAWLPWVLWGLSTALGREHNAGRGAAAAWSALAFALAILAGHPQTVLYIFYLSLGYTGLHLWLAWRSRPAGFSAYRLLLSLAGRWAGITLLGSLVAAAQLLPTLEFISYSLRANLAYGEVAAGLPLHEFISILYPGFLGGSPGYVGIVSLILIGLALVLARPRPQVVFWAGAGLLSLLLAFGGGTFLYSVFYLLVPGFDAVRQQERSLLIYSFSAAMLAGLGALAVAGPLNPEARAAYRRFERRLRHVLAVALGLAVLLLYGSTAAAARGDEINLFFGVLWHHFLGLLLAGGVLLWLAGRPRRWLTHPWAMGLLAAWLAFNLFTVNWRFNLEKPGAATPFVPDGLTQFLQARLPSPPDPNRAAAEPARIASGGLLPGGHSAAAVYHLEDLTGNTPLQLARIARFAEVMPAWRFWQLMNVRYVVDRRDIGDPGLKLVFDGGERKVFEVNDPFPRAWLVSKVEVLEDDEAAAARLAADEFDLRQAAVVPAPLPQPLAEAASGAVTLSRVGPADLAVTVDAVGPHLLVISQVYYPGWLAMIDGQPAPVWRVNVVQQGVVVPAGRHTVKIIYRPSSFWWGCLLSILGLLVCVLLWIGPGRLKRLLARAGYARQKALPTAERLADL